MKNQFILALFTLLIAVKTNADSLYVGAMSYHFVGYPTTKNAGEVPFKCPHNYEHCAKPTPTIPKKPDFNNENYLIAYEHNGYGVGYFLNSFDQDTVFIDKQAELKKIGDLSIIVHGGAVSGYYGCDYRNHSKNVTICPYIYLEAAYTKYELQPVILVTTTSASIAAKWVF